MPSIGSSVLSNQDRLNGHLHSGMAAHSHGLATHKHFHEQDPGWLSFVLRSTAAQSEQDLHAALVEIAKAEPVLRSKGFVQLDSDDAPQLVQGVRTRVSITPEPARKGSDKSEPDTKVTLYVFECSMAAYNASEVFYLFDALGLHRLSFAEPHMDITYKPGGEQDSKLKSMKVGGFTATEQLINAEFDDKTNSISSFSKWRGIGDASSNGTWVFDDGQFVLKDYDVDPTYDGEQNSITVIQGGKIKLAP